MQTTHPQAKDMRRTLIRVVLPALRRQGLVARANFMCCQSCATAALEGPVAKRNAPGAVYWHRQDDEGMLRTARLNLRYGSLGGEKAAKKVGELAVAAVRASGLRAAWDGDVCTTILVEP